MAKATTTCTMLVTPHGTDQRAYELTNVRSTEE